MKKNGRAKSVVSIIVILLILAAAGFVGYNIFQVKHVLIAGNEQYTSEYLIGLANIEAETHMLKVDEALIKENIESDPHLELVKVDYELPDTVVLTVLERQPNALINYAGSILLVDRLLNVMEIDALQYDGSYPYIDGIVVDAINLGKQVTTKDTYKLSVATAILDGFKSAQIDEFIQSIDLTDANNIKLKSKGGPDVLFGQGDQVEEKIHWIKRILPTLIQDGKTTGSIDVSIGNSATYRLDDAQTGEQVQTEDTQGTQNGETQGSQEENTQETQSAENNG